MVVVPALVKLRRLSRFGTSCRVRSRRSVTCWSVSSRVAPGQVALHDHGAEGEGRILGAAELVEGADPRGERDDHDEDGDRAVADGPAGEIEAAHGWPRLPGCPGRSGVGWHRLGPSLTSTWTGKAALRAARALSPSRRTCWPGRRVWTPAVTTISPASSPWDDQHPVQLIARPRRYCAGDPVVARVRTQTAGWPLGAVSAEAGIAMPALPAELDGAGDGGAEPHGRRRARRGPPGPGRCGSPGPPGARPRAPGRCAAPWGRCSGRPPPGHRRQAASMTRAGTSKTASRPPWRASWTIMRPAATTSPGSAPRAVTVPGPSATRS